MTSRDGNVIRFPTWRREASGAPGVPDEGAGPAGRPESPAWQEAWRPNPVPRVEAVDGLDRPVWHEGTVGGENIVRLRADLLGIRPPIWRRLELRSSLTLAQVRPVLVAAFGFDPDVEHRFREVVRDDGATRAGRTFINEWARPPRDHGVKEWDVTLGQVLPEPRCRLRYFHGRRLGFDVTIVAEDVIPVPPAALGDTPPARLLTGRRSGPPATVTSAGLYDLALSGFLDRPGARELVDVELPPDFDPDAIDLALLDARVRAAAET